MTGRYHSIIEHYEHCLARFGDTHKGVDWPTPAGAMKRYQIMLDLIRPYSQPVTLLDFGCGASHLFQYMLERNVQNVRYAGLDASDKFCALSKQKYPDNEYICADILQEPKALGEFDYIVMNGVFTEKRQLSFDEMFDYMRRVLEHVFAKARRGIAFNVMSKQVDWERDDLFHMAIGELTDFLTQSLSRHYIVRNDYGLYEYTVYVYKDHN